MPRLARAKVGAGVVAKLRRGLKMAYLGKRQKSKLAGTYRKAINILGIGWNVGTTKDK